MRHFVEHPAGIGSNTQFAIHIKQGSGDEHIVRAGGGRGKLARERVGRGAGGRGRRAGGGSERSSEGVRRREDDAVVGGEHQAEVGERGEGVVTGERVEEGVPRGHIARGSGDILEDGEGGREERPREGAVEGD